MPGFSDVLVITGGIGSGKSHVGRQLSALGWAVIDADHIGHEALEIAKDQIRQRWPEAVGPEGIDRTRLGRLVFSNAALVAELEAITHPLIERLLVSALERSGRPVAVEVSAAAFLDRVDDSTILVVDASQAERRARAINRGMDPTDVDRRLASQPPRRGWLALADVVLLNQGADLDPAIRALDGAFGG